MIVTVVIKPINIEHIAKNPVNSWTERIGTRTTTYFLGIPIHTKKEME